MKSASAPQRRVGETGASSDQGLAILSYLFAGIGLYGGLGWLGDHAFGTGFLLPVGLVIGMAISLYGIIKRYGGGA